MTKPGILALADGSVFHGVAIGANGTTVGEVVFNTSITGYQEIITDPSYLRQIVTLTYPHIGNVGVNDDDAESPQIMAAGLIIRDLPLRVSNWRSQGNLQDYLIAQGIVAIAEIDTRRLTRLLRERGAQDGCLMTGANLDEKLALEKARAFPGLKGLDLAREVTTKQPYEWPYKLEQDGISPTKAIGGGTWRLTAKPTTSAASTHVTTAADQSTYHVVAYDYGIKTNILRMLTDHGCRVTVVPASTPASSVLALHPSGIFLSNGPGDPEPCDYAIRAIREILPTGIPIFGICLGHQLLALACGARTLKMKFGHHGANHPVQDLATGAVLITSQNHGFAVDETSLPANVHATHRSLFDGSLQGITHADYPAFSFQGHPEASPGPHDIHSLFTKFTANMAKA